MPIDPTANPALDHRRDVPLDARPGAEQARTSRSTRSARPCIVTTSWDDGDPCDLRITEMLSARKVAGTFYLPITGHLKSRSLTPDDLRALASCGFEVGAHSLSHLALPRLIHTELAREVGYCKVELEDILSREVRMFAYPQGRYNRAVVRAVQKAGYAGARTTQMLADALDFDPFRMPTTLQVFPHSRSHYLKNLTRGVAVGRTWRYVTRFVQCRNWVELGTLLFDEVLQEGGVWHLYGHSWEIDELNLWSELEQILDYVQGREGVTYATNSEVLAFCPARLRMKLRSEAVHS